MKKIKGWHIITISILLGLAVLYGLAVFTSNFLSPTPQNTAAQKYLYKNYFVYQKQTYYSSDYISVSDGIGALPAKATLLTAKNKSPEIYSVPPFSQHQLITATFYEVDNSEMGNSGWNSFLYLKNKADDTVATALAWLKPTTVTRDTSLEKADKNGNWDSFYTYSQADAQTMIAELNQLVKTSGHPISDNELSGNALDPFFTLNSTANSKLGISFCSDTYHGKTTIYFVLQDNSNYGWTASNQLANLLNKK